MAKVDRRNVATILDLLHANLVDQFADPDPVQQAQEASAKAARDKAAREASAAKAADDFAAKQILDRINAENALASGLPAPPPKSPLDPGFVPFTAQQQADYDRRKKELQDSYDRAFAYFTARTDNELLYEAHRFGLTPLDPKKFGELEFDTVQTRAFADVFVSRRISGRITIQDGRFAVGMGQNEALATDAAKLILAGLLTPVPPEPQGPPNYPLIQPPSPFPDKLPGSVAVVPGAPGAAGTAIPTTPGNPNAPLPPGRLRPPVDNQGNVIGGPFGPMMPDGFFQANPADP